MPTKSQLPSRLTKKEFRQRLSILAGELENAFALAGLTSPRIQPESFHESLQADSMSKKLAVGLIAFASQFDWDSSADQQRLDWLIDTSRGSLRGHVAGFRSLLAEHRKQLEFTRHAAWNRNRKESSPYEFVLSEICSAERKQRGVYFTPHSICDLIVEMAVGELVRNRLSDLGEKESDPDLDGIETLDPAMGDGAFLRSYLRFASKRISDRPDQLAKVLKNVCGFELCPAATILSVWNLIQSVPIKVLDYLEASELRLYCLDTIGSLGKLDHNSGWASESNALTLSADHRQLEHDLFEASFDLIIGNPPFGSLTTQANLRMRELMRGKMAADPAARNYYWSDHSTGSRKSWLHDIYVQFFRYAQWRIDKAGQGTVALISNSNFCDNMTFAGMRKSLLDGFERIQVHSFDKLSQSRELAEASFPIRTDLAVTIMTRTDSASLSTDKKQVSLDQKPIIPQPPGYRFAPTRKRSAVWQRHGIPIDQVMPLFASAIVTARDWLCVGFSRSELVDRIRQFADPSVSEAEFRKIAERKTRSTRYPAGDSRGWSLSAARQKLAEDPNWPDSIVPCCYRAMDQRWIALHEDLVDWPRKTVMPLLNDGNNLALVTRKQMVPGRPTNFFWIADRPVIDGIIRSDNRGNEIVFPLFKEPCSGLGRESWTNANFDSEFEFHKLFETPGSALGFVYAQFCSSNYQRDFQLELVDSIPRIFLIEDDEARFELARLGCELIEAHLLRNIDQEQQPLADVAQSWQLPVWQDHRMSVAGVELPQVSKEVFEFKAGHHQVARKWVKDRKGIAVTRQEFNRYLSTLQSIKKAIEIREDIDRLINRVGVFDGGKA